MMNSCKLIEKRMERQMKGSRKIMSVSEGKVKSEKLHLKTAVRKSVPKPKPQKNSDKDTAKTRSTSNKSKLK